MLMPPPLSPPFLIRSILIGLLELRHFKEEVKGRSHCEIISFDIKEISLLLEEISLFENMKRYLSESERYLFLY